jgi:hypothetical protein
LSIPPDRAVAWYRWGGGAPPRTDGTQAAGGGGSDCGLDAQNLGAQRGWLDSTHRKGEGS